MNGTEQNQNGLTDDNEDLFELAFQSTLNRKPVEVKEIKEESVESEGTAAEESKETAATTTEEGNDNTETGTEAGKDPLADLPENVRNIILQKEKELETARRAELEWKQKYKSDEGRIAALQRQKQEYERALRERQQPQQQTEQKQTESKLKVEETEEWKVLQESDPALAKLFKQFAEETTRQAEERAEARTRAATEPLYREREVSVQEQKRVRLTQLVPDLPKIVEDDNYFNWFQYQPPAIQQMADGSADEIAYVIGLFAKDRPDLFAPPQDSQKTTQETVKQPPTPAPNVDKLTQERQRKVQVQGVTGKVTPTPTEMSEDDMFKLAFKNNLVKR